MVNFYSAAVSQENVLRGSLTTLAGRMFQGSFGAMASFLVSSGKLSPEEVQALKKILDKQSGEKK
jgi:predicted transcriptional regulator